MREGAQVHAVTLHVQPRERYAYDPGHGYDRRYDRHYDRHYNRRYDRRYDVYYDRRYDHSDDWRRHRDDHWPPRHGSPFDRHHRHDRHCRH
ncbi:MAG: hypothetical protein FJ194_16765 [Gammaproteobacteria bacterium]|nr:hypothetical protein [Gammaproteobacteria bacterium]